MNYTYTGIPRKPYNNARNFDQAFNGQWAEDAVIEGLKYYKYPVHKSDTIEQDCYINNQKVEIKASRPYSSVYYLRVNNIHLNDSLYVFATYIINTNIPHLREHSINVEFSQPIRWQEFKHLLIPTTDYIRCADILGEWIDGESVDGGANSKWRGIFKDDGQWDLSGQEVEFIITLDILKENNLM